MRKQFTLRIEDDLWAWLVEQSASEHLSISTFIQRILRDEMGEEVESFPGGVVLTGKDAANFQLTSQQLEATIPGLSVGLPSVPSPALRRAAEQAALAEVQRMRENRDEHGFSDDVPTAEVD